MGFDENVLSLIADKNISATVRARPLSSRTYAQAGARSVLRDLMA